MEAGVVLQAVRGEVMADWKTEGIRIVRAGELDSNTPQTPGMTRAAAITHARTGADKLWAGTVVVEPAARTAAHHHGEVETIGGRSARPLLVLTDAQT